MQRKKRNKKKNVIPPIQGMVLACVFLEALII